MKSTIKYLVILTFIFQSSNVFGQSDDQIIIVDTLHLNDALSAIYNHKHGQVGVILERNDLDLLTSKKNIINDPRVFLHQSGFLKGNYPQNNCKYGRTITESGIIYQEFLDQPSFFILISVKTNNYIETQSSIDNNLNRLLRKTGAFQRVLIPRCNVEDVHGG